jgi:hypothetical protein
MASRRTLRDMQWRDDNSPVAARRVTSSEFGRWRSVDGPHLVALVRADATFIYDKFVEQPDDHYQPKAA